MPHIITQFLHSYSCSSPTPFHTVPHTAHRVPQNPSPSSIPISLVSHNSSQFPTHFLKFLHTVFISDPLILLLRQFLTQIRHNFHTVPHSFSQFLTIPHTCPRSPFRCVTVLHAFPQVSHNPSNSSSEGSSQALHTLPLTVPHSSSHSSYLT